MPNERRLLIVGDKIRASVWDEIDRQHHVTPLSHYLMTHIKYNGRLKAVLMDYGPYTGTVNEFEVDYLLTNDDWYLFDAKPKVREPTGFGKFLREHGL